MHADGTHANRAAGTIRIGIACSRATLVYESVTVVIPAIADLLTALLAGTQVVQTDSSTASFTIVRIGQTVAAADQGQGLALTVAGVDATTIEMTVHTDRAVCIACAFRGFAETFMIQRHLSTGQFAGVGVAVAILAANGCVA